jgi:hypothetical protein
MEIVDANSIISIGAKEMRDNKQSSLLRVIVKKTFLWRCTLAEGSDDQLKK